MNTTSNISANKAYKAYCQSLSDPSTAISFKQWLINQKNQTVSNETANFNTPEETGQLKYFNADAAANAPDTKIRVLGMPIVVAVPVLLVAGYAAFRVIKYFVNRNKTVTT